MPDDSVQPPARREPEPQSVDFDVIDDDSSDDGSDAANMQFTAADIMRMGSEMMAEALHQVFLSSLKKLAVRILIFGGVLGLFATEHGWARFLLIAFSIYAFIHLAILLYGLYVSKRKPEKLMRLFSRMMPPGTGLQ